MHCWLSIGVRIANGVWGSSVRIHGIGDWWLLLIGRIGGPIVGRRVLIGEIRRERRGSRRISLLLLLYDHVHVRRVYLRLWVHSIVSSTTITTVIIAVINVDDSVAVADDWWIRASVQICIVCTGSCVLYWMLGVGRVRERRGRGGGRRRMKRRGREGRWRNGRERGRTRGERGGGRRG